MLKHSSDEVSNKVAKLPYRASSWLDKYRLLAGLVELVAIISSAHHSSKVAWIVSVECGSFAGVEDCNEADDLLLVDMLDCEKLVRHPSKASLAPT